MLRGEEVNSSMNIYLITRSECHYDEYDSFVVAANNPIEAMDYLDKEYHHKYKYSEWPDEGVKEAKLIGTTDKYKEVTEILGSFNAG